MGRWDPTPLNQMIEEGEFSLIVLDTPAEHPRSYDGFAWWPPGTRERIAAHYRFADRLGRHYLYEPARPSSSLTPRN